MTKRELNAKVLELCKEHKAPQALTDALDELTKAKSGGKSDVNDYTCYDAEGNVTYILCTVFKKWLPVSHFKEGKTPNGFNRYSVEGDKDWKGRAKAFKEGKQAVIDDLLEGKIENDAAKKKIAALEEARGKVGTAPKEATDKRPCADKA